ncbi:regulatory protein spx [Pilibacter termitis]|uniref:Global transcriptional regulator Spx n=1 Tax=Pilibacter termitis TaxID=263852 RepID=A0A1T4NIF0_9ENTE|nr:transcriptional regulator Spx [Pilibacter termitis]SJZ79070.1 regulatory protein spx [Pilibacter termitis]
MITLFSSPSCTSCRKARNWFDGHGIEYKERNIMSSPIKKEELRKILSLSLEGTEDIISTRSKVFQKLNVDLEEMSLSQLLELVEKHPSLLRRPLIMDTKRLQIGFNEDEIRAFLPRDVRKMELRHAQMMAGI